MGLNKSKFSATQVKNCMRTFLVHLFSHVGLCILVVGYAVAGGFLFERIESKYETDENARKINSWRTEFSGIRRECALALWNITERLNVLHEKNWTKEVEVELDRFLKDIAEKAKDNNNWNGENGNEPQWTFSRALMYSVSIITTIGYGNTAPQTPAGKILTMFYAVIGVPLMLLWVSNIGNLMANTFKFAYAHGPCCSASNRKSNNNRRNNKSSNSTVQPNNFNRKGSTKINTKSQPPVNYTPVETSATQVQYSVNEHKCETRLLESSNKIHRKGNGGTGTLQGLTAGAKQLLLECAEYNVSQGQDERSRRILEQLQAPENSILSESTIFPPNGDEDSPEQSEVESVIDLHATILRVQNTNEEDEEAVHALDCCPYPPYPPYPFYDANLSPPPSGGGILRKPSMTNPQVKKTVSLIESYSPAHGTPSRIPLLPREEICPDLVDIEKFSMDSATVIHDKNFGEDDRVPTTLVLSIVVIYILSGAGAFTYLEKWPFHDSAYFCFITLSTIGLGDLTPGKSLDYKDLTSDTDTGTAAWATARLVFCCLYLVLGLAIIAMSFSLVQEDLTRRTKNIAKRIGIIREDDI